MKIRYPLFLLLGSALVASSAWAGESLFSRVYTAQTVPAGHYELEQLVRYRTERAFGHYNALDFKSEFEYGVTDNFQVALYFNNLYMNAIEAPDDNDASGDQPGNTRGFTRNGFFAQSLSTEFIYRVLSPISDPVGLAFYLEPEWDFHDMHNGDKEYDSLELEFRILLQKNLLEDQLILAYNFVLEDEYFRYMDGENLWMGELDFNNEIGASYRVAPKLYAGWELRNHNEVGNFYSHDHSVFWTGPAIHYAAEHVWVTAGVLKQIYGDPDGYDSAGSYQGDGLFLHSHEMWETTLKVGVPF